MDIICMGEMLIDFTPGKRGAELCVQSGRGAGKCLHCDRTERA